MLRTGLPGDRAFRYTLRRAAARRAKPMSHRARRRRQI